MAYKVISKWFIMAVVVLLSVSCASEKDKYVDRYTRFAANVLNNSSTFTSLDWEATIVQYEELRNEYRYHSSEMTLEERQRIDELNTKINARIIEQSTNDAIDTFKGVVDEIIGTINELAK